MELKKKNTLILIFLIILIIEMLAWAIGLLWFGKYLIIWEPFLFIAILSAVAILVVIPGFFFVKKIKIIKKSLKERQKLNFSKRFIAGTSLIAIIFNSLTIIAVVMYTVPSALFYNYDDGPYLIWNDDPKTTMTIVWHTAEPSESLLKYGTDPDDLDSVQNPFAEKRHIISLKNLKPDTTYYYKIPNFSDELYNFTTAPDNTGPFSFVTIGDTQNLEPGKKSNYDDVIEAMQSYDYDFLVHAGDFSIDGSNLLSWHTIFDDMVKHGSRHPYQIALGNHDYGADLFARNFKYFFPYNYVEDWGHYYSFSYSNAHFIMLDCFQNELDWGNYIPEMQELWLRNELAANKDKWLFVTLHASPLSTGDFNMNQAYIQQLLPIFYEYEVDVVFSGHDHHYESFWLNRTADWGGTYYIVTGGGGGHLDEFIMERDTNPWKHEWHNSSIEPYQDDYFTKHDQLYGEITHHFMYCQVDDTELTLQAIRDNGTLIQEFNIKK